MKTWHSYCTNLLVVHMNVLNNPSGWDKFIVIVKHRRIGTKEQVFSVLHVLLESCKLYGEVFCHQMVILEDYHNVHFKL